MSLAFERWGNPSSAHQLGREAHEFAEESRGLIAQKADAEPTEIVFTSGGSEANTLALWGFVLNRPGARLMTSRVEHSSIRDTMAMLEKQGTIVDYIAVGRTGQIDLPRTLAQLDSFKPDLVSLMAANNETGVVFPIPEIAEACAARKIALHVDAVPAFGKLPPSHWAGAHYVSLSAHKIYGPKGIGALVVRRGGKLMPTHYGGSQEIKRRGGTENTIGIAGFGGACSELLMSTAAPLRDEFERRLRAEISDLEINGAGEPRLPNTSNVRFPGIANEVLLSALDLHGIYVSAGSACSSGSISPSHVLLEMGLTPQEAKECLRFSWGRSTTSEAIAKTADVVISEVKRIRARRRG